MNRTLQKIMDKMRGKSGLVLFEEDAKSFQQTISFISALNLRLWLLRKRPQWAVQKLFRRLKR